MSLILRLLRIFFGVLFCVLHCDSAVAGTPYTFPDPGLQAAVAEAIGKATTELTLEDLSSPYFTLLPAERRKIHNLEGIEQCTSLIELILSDNEITDLRPLSKMTWLRSLSIDDNLIDDLTPLSTLTHLEDLWLGYNVVSELSPLRSLKDLKALEANHNNIKDLKPLGELHNLRHLWLAQNQISDTSALSRLVNLRSLGVAYNQIQDASLLAKLPDLSQIDLLENRVSNIHPFLEEGAFTKGTHIGILYFRIPAGEEHQYELAVRKKGITIGMDYKDWSIDHNLFSPSVPGFNETWKPSPNKDNGVIYSISSEAISEVWSQLGADGWGVKRCVIRMVKPLEEYSLSVEQLDQCFLAPLWKSCLPTCPPNLKYYLLEDLLLFNKRLAQRINFHLGQNAVMGIQTESDWNYVMDFF